MSGWFCLLTILTSFCLLSPLSLHWKTECPSSLFFLCPLLAPSNPFPHCSHRNSKIEISSCHSPVQNPFGLPIAFRPHEATKPPPSSLPSLLSGPLSSFALSPTAGQPHRPLGFLETPVLCSFRGLSFRIPAPDTLLPFLAWRCSPILFVQAPA